MASGSKYIGNGVAAQGVRTSLYPPVRQTVIAGALDANGYANFFSIGAGLAINLAATTTPLIMAFAGGYNSGGSVDRLSLLSADVASFVSALQATNTNYITAAYVNEASVTWGSTLNPPQYGYAYDKTKQSLLKFAGADASTSIIDDFGNTWTAVGNAQVDTAVQIDTLNTLLCDGTGDYVENTQFTSLGGGSWTIECKVRWNTLPAASTQVFFGAFNAGGFGAQLALNDTAGTKKLSLWLSSNGSSWDIASALLGTSTVWATATTYHIALTYDALAGKYFVYKDGVAEAAQTTTSALRVCGITKIRLGVDSAAASGFNGCMAGFRFAPYCRYPNGTTFVAPTISTFVVEGDFFSIPEMKMYTVSAASVVAGTNPIMTAGNKLYVGEADTSAGAVTAVRNYAYQGQYVSADTTVPAVGINTAFASNIGNLAQNVAVYLRNYVGEGGWTVGGIISVVSPGTARTTLPIGITDRNTLNVVTGSSAVFQGINKTNGTEFSVTAASWKMFVVAQRGW